MDETVRSRQQVWNYMASEVFQSRYLVAANYLRDCSHVLEIGGCSTPITNYLRGAHASVTVVDPLVAPVQAETLNDRPCVVRHIPVRLEEYQPTGQENGFVFLGMPQLPLAPLLDIMRRCTVSVLEFPSAFLPSCLMFQSILASGHFNVTARIVFDLSHNEIASLSDSSMTTRHLFVLTPRNAAAGDGRLSKWLRISDGYVRAARRRALRQDIRDRSALFLREHFHAGYARLKALRDDKRARDL